MKNINTDLLELFKNRGFELLFADVLQPEAYSRCCRLLPNFCDWHNELTGNFIDELESLGLIDAYNLAMFDDINVGAIGGFYCGFEKPLIKLLETEPKLTKVIGNFLKNENFYSLSHALRLDGAYVKAQDNLLRKYIEVILQELSIAQDFNTFNCVRASLWFKDRALLAKKLVLNHLQALSIDNNLPSLYRELAREFPFESAMKVILMTFYDEKKISPECMDTSPLFTVIDTPKLEVHYKELFEPFYKDEFTRTSSHKGECLFDINERSTHPQRKGYSAIGYALKCQKVDIAYALFRSKAQFNSEEFSHLIHLLILQQDSSYHVDDVKKLSNNTFQIINNMLENNLNNISGEYVKRFKRLFHSWLVRGSDLERQQLFLEAIECEMLTLALHLFDKPGVNINTKSSKTGKTLLHIALENKNIDALLKVSSHAQCDLNSLDFELKHVLQKSSDPTLLAPIVFYLLHRSGEGVLVFMAQKIKEYLDSNLISCNKKQGLELVSKVRDMVVHFEGEGL